MEVSMWMWAAGGIAAALVVVPSLKPDPKKRALAKARATGELDAVIDYVEGGVKLSKVDAWDQLFLELWQRYDRELAARLIMAITPKYTDTKIFHHWINQVMQIEPEIASEVFTQDFLMTHYRPELASQCGKCGCGG